AARLARPPLALLLAIGAPLPRLRAAALGTLLRPLLGGALRPHLTAVKGTRPLARLLGREHLLRLGLFGRRGRLSRRLLGRRLLSHRLLGRRLLGRRLLSRRLLLGRGLLRRHDLLGNLVRCLRRNLLGVALRCLLVHVLVCLKH